MTKGKYSHYRGGLIHKLKTKELSKQGDFKIQEGFLCGLNEALLTWFNLIIQDKIKTKRMARIWVYDLWTYAPEFQNIVKQLKGGIKKK